MSTDLKYEVTRTVYLPGGGSITVTVGSSEPINEEDYLILRHDAITEMAECLSGLANTLRPPGSPEIVLDDERKGER